MRNPAFSVEERNAAQGMWRSASESTTIDCIMNAFSRRDFLASASALVLTSAASSQAARLTPQKQQHVFVGSGTDKGILAFDWESERGTLTATGEAFPLADATWITLSADHRFLFAATEKGSVNGQPIGRISSFRVEKDGLILLSAQSSAAQGTCHVALDHTGRVLLSADYGGGGSASFLVEDGRLTPAVWTTRFTGSGPNKSRQESAHAHFASFSPDNRFAYINDLGSDCIHIFRLDAVSGKLSPTGEYRAKAGAGPRTLRFHPNGHTAYSVNELDSTVDVLEWSSADGSLKRTAHFEMLPADYKDDTRACDTVISHDGRSVYFANRDNDFLYSFHADAKTGALTPVRRSSAGGKIPRSFTLDPSERWMLVCCQGSNEICVFARDPKSGSLSDECRRFSAPTPMSLVFV